MTAASSSAASRITVGEPADAGARSCARVADVAAVGSDAACAVGSEVMDAGVSAVASVVISVCSDAATSVVSAVVSAASVCVVPASSVFVAILYASPRVQTSFTKSCPSAGIGSFNTAPQPPQR